MIELIERTRVRQRWNSRVIQPYEIVDLLAEFIVLVVFRLLHPEEQFASVTSPLQKVNTA